MIYLIWEDAFLQQHERMPCSGTPAARGRRDVHTFGSKLRVLLDHENLIFAARKSCGHLALGLAHQLAGFGPRLWGDRAHQRIQLRQRRCFTEVSGSYGLQRGGIGSSGDGGERLADSSIYGRFGDFSRGRHETQSYFVRYGSSVLKEEPKKSPSHIRTSAKERTERVPARE